MPNASGSQSVATTSTRYISHILRCLVRMADCLKRGLKQQLGQDEVEANRRYTPAPKYPLFIHRFRSRPIVVCAEWL